MRILPLLIFLWIPWTSAINYNLSVKLNSSWIETPLLAETAEFLAQKSSNNFWEFLEKLGNLSEKKNQDLFNHDALISPQAMRLLENIVLDVLEMPATDDGNRNLQKKLFHLILTSRAMSPAVQTAHELASVAYFEHSSDTNAAEQTSNIEQNRPSSCPDSTTWANIGSSFVCELSELKGTVKRALYACSNGCPTSTSSHVILSDNVYPSSGDAKKMPRLIVNGDLRTHEFYLWHKVAKSLAQSNSCTYVFRYFFKNASKSTTPLNGYGVELALKSTEYKAMDDSKQDSGTVEDSKKDISATPNFPGSDAVVQGFNFSQLLRQYPEFKTELFNFHSHLLDTSTEVRPLKAWQMQDLGLQASQMIMDSVTSHITSENDSDSSLMLAGHKGLLALQDISQNFPVRASLRSEVEVNQALLGAKYGVIPGSSLFLLNGLALSPTVDIFALLDLLRSESYLLNQLHGLGLSMSQATKLMQSPEKVHGNILLSSYSENYKLSVTGQHLLDMRLSPIAWLNDLEKNSAYANWPRTPRALFMPSAGNSIRQVAINLFNIVLIVDPSNPDSMEMIRMAESFILQNVGVRMGILWAINPEVESVGVYMARAFIYLNETMGYGGRTTDLGLGFRSAMTALSFLTDIYAIAGHDDGSGTRQQLSVDLLRTEFKRAFPEDDADEVFGQDGFECVHDNVIKNHYDYLKSSGIMSAAGSPSLLINGMLFDAKAISQLGGFEDAVMSSVMEHTMYLQHAVYESRFGDSSQLFDLFAKDGLLKTHINRRLLTAAPPPINKFSVADAIVDNSLTPFLQFGSLDASIDLDNLKTTPAGDITNILADQMLYLQKGDLENTPRPTTVWVVVGHVEPGTTESKYNLNLLKSAALFMRKQASSSTRLGFIFNPMTAVGSVSKAKTAWGAPGWFTRAMLLIGHPSDHLMTKTKQTKSLTSMNMMAAKNFAIKLIDEALRLAEGKSTVSDFKTLSVGGMEEKQFLEAFAALDVDKSLKLHTTFSQKVLNLKPGDAAVIINGRVHGPLTEGEEFTAADFRLAEQLAAVAGTEAMASNLELMLPPGTSAHRVSELVWRVASVLESTKWRLSGFANSLSAQGIFASGSSSSRISLNGLRSQQTVFNVPPSGSGHLHYDIVAVVDPASRDAQRFSQMLLILQQALPCNITVIMNPVMGLSDLPLKSFYRFVWQSKGLEYGERPIALFENLPGNSLLTLGVDAPHNWMVGAARADEDLDNLRLFDIASKTGKQSVEAEFQLEYLLLEGHCLDDATKQPPRGLQFTLGTAQYPVKYDTIVMANLGYFQLKANPGAWYLNLREGKSHDIYSIVSHEHADSPLDASSVVAVMDSFRPKIVRISVQKRPSHLKESVLEGGLDDKSHYEEDEKKDEGIPGFDIEPYAQTFRGFWKLVGSFMQDIKSRLTCFHSKEEPASKPTETINIFSLASGHLYERLIRIMMLSVIRNTNSPVKFWFLKNYLSPQFKEFIPHMAAEYGFEYELVQYQWPRWLHAQTEKQRIIWGYKILFLDVLFPLHVKKIIFVDADQVVRTDLKELVDLDLEGAPYGYTPFCESRKAMKGFQFWKTGYWSQHLGNRPYHISALYVIDLVRFRKMAAGDRLRGQYHALSQDPNSLSNLDQDLPNNMIHQVPIKSLPQEWLWCETWCSDESKAKAKTIDLCNNPMTKEPKLSAAMRIIPEWGNYDVEIKNLQRRISMSTEFKVTNLTASASKTTLPSISRTDKAQKEVTKKKTEL